MNTSDKISRSLQRLSIVENAKMRGLRKDSCATPVASALQQTEQLDG